MINWVCRFVPLCVFLWGFVVAFVDHLLALFASFFIVLIVVQKVLWCNIHISL